MLGNVGARLVEKSPTSVMVRGTLERVLGAEQRDAWFARTAQQQYTRSVCFAMLSDILSHVVVHSKPSVRAASRAPADPVGASLLSLYNPLHGGQPPTSRPARRWTIPRPPCWVWGWRWSLTTCWRW